MSRQRLMLIGFAGLTAFMIACGGHPSSPTSPSGAASSANVTGPDGTLFKATAPVPASPANGTRITQGQPVVLVVNNSQTFEPNLPPTYRFEIKDANGAIVDSTVVSSGTATTSKTVTASLIGDQTYNWRARAEFQGVAGPWSTSSTFVAPANDGYIRGTELYDPLINGRTVGTVHGSTTFTSQGLRINDQASWVDYQLGGTLTAGEFSVLITTMGNNTTGLKTKVFSMSSGYADMTTNPRRFTIEKRGGAEPGSIAWRVIPSGPAIETIGNERQFKNFNPGLSYFFRATWGNGQFRLTIDEGGVGGTRIYDFPRAYTGVYDPAPHIVFLGSPAVSSGIDSQTVPGMTLRQVWVSANPRPAFANQ